MSNSTNDKVNAGVILPRALYQRIVEYGEHRGLSLSAVMRLATSQYLDKVQPQKQSTKNTR
ncbi:hypothetical protein D0B32_02120 [Paraburkholderia sp. DHOC27]|nr:hypothetical protein D0B32_02120 [Paraburkholderia sp. DHOC27]